MNIKKLQDKTAAYLARDGKWFKMDKESVRRVIGRPRLKNSAKLTFFALQPYFHDGQGFLFEPLENVASGMDETTAADLEADISKLEKVGILRRTNGGLLYDPVSFKLITGLNEPADAKFRKISQDSAEFGENLHSPLGQNAALDKIRGSSSAASNAAAEERTDLFNYQNEEEGKKDDGSRRLPSFFPFLKMNDVKEVQAEHPELDWADLISLFIAKNEKTKPQLVNRKWFETFVVGYINRKRNGGGAATAGPVIDPEAEKIRLARLPKLELRPVKEKYVWFIGEKPVSKMGIKDDDFDSLCRNMTPKTTAQANAYLRKLVPNEEWNTMHALEDVDELFTLDDDGLWRGSEYETEEERTDREELELARAEAKRKAAEAEREERIRQREAEEAEKARNKELSELDREIQLAWDSAEKERREYFEALEREFRAIDQKIDAAWHEHERTMEREERERKQKEERQAAILKYETEVKPVVDSDFARLKPMREEIMGALADLESLPIKEAVKFVSDHWSCHEVTAGSIIDGALREGSLVKVIEEHSCIYYDENGYASEDIIKKHVGYVGKNKDKRESVSAPAPEEEAAIV